MSYFVITLIAVFLGQCARYIEKNLILLCLDEINYKEFFENFKIKKIKENYKVDIAYSAILALLFNLIYIFCTKEVTYVYMLLLPVLLVIFSIDYKIQIIPDEVHLYVIILGIISMIFDKNVLDHLLGCVIGGGIFLAIACLSYIILKKEGMGMGDVKLMASLGFLLGRKNILVVTLLSFIIGAIVGSILLAIKRKGKNSYIPFGPFIVIAVIIIMFIPSDYIIEMYINFCTFLGRGVTDFIWNITSKG